MPKLVVGLCLSLALCAVPQAAVADVAAFTTCLTDSLNGKERKLLARWVYFAMAAHPELLPFATVPDSARQTSDQEVARLVTRLLAEDCAQPFRVAQNQNPQALQQAFAIMGEVAMQELMANQKVEASISNYGRYLDEEKIKAALQ